MKKNSNVKVQLDGLLDGLPGVSSDGALASGLAVHEQSLPAIAGGMMPINSTSEGCCQGVSDKTKIED